MLILVSTGFVCIKSLCLGMLWSMYCQRLPVIINVYSLDFERAWGNYETDSVTVVYEQACKYMWILYMIGNRVCSCVDTDIKVYVYMICN